jgi:Uma2 family endonuclease
MLPDKDGSTVKNAQEPPQSQLLTDSLRPVLARLHPDGQYFIGQDLGIFWRPTDPPLLGCLAPDWFYVPNVPALLEGQMRRSYVMWREVVFPLVALEYVSGSGAEEREQTPWTGKYWIYEQGLRVPFYGIFDPRRDRLDVFHLVDAHYRPLAANQRGHFPIPVLGVELGIWHGAYQGATLPWLRWWDADGKLLPTGEERAERLAEKLRSLGVDPEKL